VSRRTWISQHRAFNALVILKGVDGVVETVAGAALLFLRAGVIYKIVTTLTAKELSEDPDDLLANLLRHWAADFSQEAQFFAAVYFVFHGIAKVLLAGSLLLRKRWAHPVAIAFLSVFIAYAGSRLSHGWSWVLAAAIVVDLVTAWFIAREWQATA
jgi:uncharacterized membrane protein